MGTRSAGLAKYIVPPFLNMKVRHYVGKAREYVTKCSFTSVVLPRESFDPNSLEREYPATYHYVHKLPLFELEY
jgi:hypothetical protein